ncbi:hypothetical protein [Burkholderia singularis]|nr:hypothetical protein [Burkholderia singularis]
MKRRDLYAEALGNMETTVHDLAGRIDPPVMTTFARTAYGFRYAERGARQAIIQKMARVVSGLRAVLLLLEHGYIQEQAVVCRMVDEACEDVSFLALGLIFEETDLHRQFLEEFFLEDFEDADRPHETRIKRPSIRRSRIHAYLSSNPAEGSNPSGGVAAMQAIHKTNSGFVHGASPHLMEMYGGQPSRFHMEGMRGTPFWSDHAADVWNYMYRAIISFAMAARAFGDDALFAKIHAYSKDFEKSEPR